MKEERILYFDSSGQRNTDAVIEVVSSRAATGDVRHVIACSLSGRTALRAAEALQSINVQVVCVSGSATYQLYGYQWPMVHGETREKLESMSVKIVERTPSTLSGDTIDYGLARYGYMPASWAVAETLEAIGGYGLKTAVEGVLMATDAGIIPPSVEVIAFAGTGSGADTAIIARSTFSPCMFSHDADRRFQVLEILAMPRTKTWHNNIKAGEFAVSEIDTTDAH